ncbi:SWIM zinc finger family protein [Streptomyces sp. RS10V-4]|uniref:SWIM zinc finger family protein n=1 Tax=Streptomyces rhizoryzae TaxID=2932493 RepID=UPI002002BB8C|nr:SWIM zinc finger family protein [Streptomyces rhizoryzae]MCK7622021.1 SWIM zinc finger family protein [Streptomyces rhizoryzae]
MSPGYRRRPAATGRAAAADRLVRADRSRTFPPLPAAGGTGEPGAASWWGGAWLDALERGALDAGRLARGRAYARDGHVDTINITPGRVIATVRGSRPRPYSAEVRVRTLSGEEWDALLEGVTAHPDQLAALLAKRLPGELAEGPVRLLPGPGDLVPRCSCPDSGRPCKHAAAVCFQVARLLDADPFVLLLMRGRGERELLDDLTRRSAGHDARRTRPAPAAAAATAGAAAGAPPVTADPAASRGASPAGTCAADPVQDGRTPSGASGAHDPSPSGAFRARNRTPSGGSGAPGRSPYGGVGAAGQPPSGGLGADGLTPSVPSASPVPSAQSAPSVPSASSDVLSASSGQDGTGAEGGGRAAPAPRGVPAREALAERRRPPLPPPLPVPERPGEPPALPDAGRLPFDAATLELLAADAAARAHACLTAGRPVPELSLPPYEDAIRLAATAHPTAGLTATTRALYRALAAATGRTPADVARSVAAWRQGGPEGLALLERTWIPPAGDFDRARSALLAAGLPALRPHHNHLTDPGRGIQLRFGRDHHWYPYESEPGTEDWWPTGPADPDPVTALTPLLAR